MSEIRVDLVTPSGMILQGTILPGELLVVEAIDALVKELQLPEVSRTGRLINYRLELPKVGPCPPGATLKEAGVSDGDRLHLVAVQKAGRRAASAAIAPPSAKRSQPHPGQGGLEVSFVIADRNTEGTGVYEPVMTAGDVIRRLMSEIGLPARDEIDEPVVYRVESRSLGRFLADRETLFEAGVPPGDRLVIHKQEHAG